MNKYKKLSYLAVPLTHKDRSVMDYRFDIVCKVAGILMKNGKKVFSPISHSYFIAQKVDLPHEWIFWRKFDKTYLNLSKELLVLTLDGWKESIGVQDEINIAKRLKIPITYINPEEILKELQ